MAMPRAEVFRAKNRKRQYASMIWLLQHYKCKAAAEVGVYLGKAAQQVLAALGSELETYLMVDPWRVYGKKGSMGEHIAGCPSFSKRTWEKTYQHALAVAKPYPCTRVLRMTSLEAAATCPPASLDLVFIDGDHSYGAVKADIEAWLPTLKPMGVLAGHDYYQNWPGVMRAVNEAFPYERLRWLPDTIWYVLNEDQ